MGKLNNWKKIWNKEDRINKIVLECLVKLNGFDSGSGKFGVEDWILYCEEHFKKMGIRGSDSIFEIGCGSGAFLFMLYLKQHLVAGIDYSPKLVGLANKFMPETNIKVNDAISYKQDKKYDVVLSHGVFFYFESLEYAEIAIRKMVDTSKRVIAILDICDEDKKEIYHKIRINKFIEDGFTEEEYWKHYKGLDHLFFSKGFFK